MSNSTTFSSGTLITHQWLNDVNVATFGANNQKSVIATAGQTVFNIYPFTYVVGAYSLSVFINGIKQLVNSSYVETSSSVVTFSSGVPLNAVVEFISPATLP